MQQTIVDTSTCMAFVQGDQKAFEIIYNLFSKHLYRRLLFLIKDPDDAEEALHNVFIKIWNNRASIDPDKNLFAYFMQVANTMAIDHLRKNLRTQSVYEQMLLLQNSSMSSSVEENFIRKEDWKIVEDAIAQLPPQRQLIFKLCKLEGKSYKEVSESLSISTATISHQLVLAMKSLRQSISEHQKEISALGILLLLSIN